uniref:Uncharacterized protein n=1 Tax=Oryza punctata TaxID=4537 RepID=A0A0E0JHA0_ORYPU
MTNHHHHHHHHHDNDQDVGANCCNIFLSILLPPFAIGVVVGCKKEFWICLLLTCLGYLPGIIYAICIISGNCAGRPTQYVAFVSN